MNTIAERIYDFLKGFPPFNMLSREQLFSIAKAVDVIYLEKDNSIFKIGEPVKNHFYVIKDGAVGLFNAQHALVDECDEGDIFGLRALLRKGDYLLNAKTLEESILYSISSELLEDFITTNSDASQFLMHSFISNTSINSETSKETESFGDTDISELQTADYSKNPITCGQDTSIKEAAIIMSQEHVGSIIISNNKKPIYASQKMVLTKLI